MALAIGGISNTSGNNGELLLELYDPIAETFSSLTTQFGATGTANHATSLTADGSRVMIAGGWNTGSPETYLFNTRIGYNVQLSATGGTAPYNFAITAGDGVLNGANYTAPPDATDVTFSVTDFLGEITTSTLTFN